MQLWRHTILSMLSFTKFLKKHSMKHMGLRFPINYCDYPCVLPVWRPIVLLNTFVFLTLLLRLSDSVGTVSENVRFTCNSRKIIPLIACDRSTDLTWSVLLRIATKAYGPLAGLTWWARHTHSLRTYGVIPLKFNFPPAITVRLTGTPRTHAL